MLRCCCWWWCWGDGKGSPTEDHWPEAQKLKYFHMFKPERPFKRRVREEFSASRCPNVPPAALDLIDKLLCLGAMRPLPPWPSLTSAANLWDGGGSLAC